MPSKPEQFCQHWRQRRRLALGADLRLVGSRPGKGSQRAGAPFQKSPDLERSVSNPQGTFLVLQVGEGERATLCFVGEGKDALPPLGSSVPFGAQLTKEPFGHSAGTSPRGGGPLSPCQWPCSVSSAAVRVGIVPQALLMLPSECSREQVPRPPLSSPTKVGNKQQQIKLIF